MKKKTYGNIEKAARLIREKGYEYQESFDMAVKMFDQLENDNNYFRQTGHPEYQQDIEQRIERILSKSDFEKEYELY